MAFSPPKLISKQLSHPDFLFLCSAHHIEGLLYKFYPEFKKNDVFRQVWVQNWHRNELALNSLVSLFEGVNLSHKPVLLKGAALLGLIYHDVGSRFMSDIDLLVHPEDFKLVEGLLGNKGYQKIESKKWKANNFKSEWSLIKDGTEICIELHSKLYYHVENSFDDYTFENSHLNGFLRLSKIDQFIHLSTHYIFQHTYQKNYWAFDLYFFTKEFITLNDIAKILKKAKRFKVRVSTQSALVLLKDHFDLNLTNESKPKVSHDFLWSTNRASVEYMMIKHQSKDSIFTALEYDFLNLFSRF